MQLELDTPSPSSAAHAFLPILDMCIHSQSVESNDYTTHPLTRTSSSSHTISCTTTSAEPRREVSKLSSPSRLAKDITRVANGKGIGGGQGPLIKWRHKCTHSEDCRSPVSDQNQFCSTRRPHKRWTVNMGTHVPVQSGAWSLITGLQLAQSYTYLRKYPGWKGSRNDA